MNMVMSMHCRANQITTVWHPTPLGEVLETPHLGNIRVLVGPAQYQLNTGEVVSLK